MPEDIALDNPLAIIGDDDAVLGFKALGLKVYAISKLQDYKKHFDEIVSDKIAICLVQDDIYRENLEIINSYKSLPLPIFIPFSKSARNELLDIMVKDIRLKATGAF
jgi:vacuolar-type H+-ATPase subunit F/Vma7